MKLLRNRWFALVIVLLIITASIAMGLGKHESRKDKNDRVFSDANLDTNATIDLNVVDDRSELLSEDLEDKIKLYNANWKDKYDSIIWVESVKKADDLSELAKKEALGIGKKDAVLIFVKKTDDFVFYCGEDFPITMDTQRAIDIAEILEIGYTDDLDIAMLQVFNKFNSYYEGNNEAKDYVVRCFSKDDQAIIVDQIETTNDSYIKNEDEFYDIKDIFRRLHITKWKAILIAIAVIWLLGSIKKK